VTRILVTGATGFIGRHCLDRLRRENCEIHAVSRQRRIDDARVHWHIADLRDGEASRRLIGSVQPSHLLHLAWEATPRVYHSSPDNLRWLEAGIALAAAFGASGGERFVGAGTCAEYEAGEADCSEDVTPIRPATIYGKCKAGCWLAVEAAAQHFDFSAAWGRIFLPYGPGDAPSRLIPSVLAALDAGRPVETTDGRQLRDFIYAPDAADLLLRLLFSSPTGAFNIATGTATAVRSVIEALADKRGRRDLLRIGALTPRPGEPARLVADMAKVQSHLAWSPRTSLDDGLNRVLNG